MKIKWKKLAIAASVIGAMTLSTAAYASPINAIGSIAFGGTYSVPNSDLTTLEQATITGIFGMTGTGVLASPTVWTGGGLGSLGFATPIGINGASPSLVNSVLWTVTAGGINWEFVVTSEAVDGTSTSTSTGLRGSGTLYDMSDSTYAPTAGIWQLGFGEAGNFSWQSTGSTVPDGGATVMLLGAALTGIGLLRRKLVA